MRRVVMVGAALMLTAGGVGVGVAVASSGSANGKYPSAAAEAAAVPEAATPVDTDDNARLVVFVDGNDSGRVVKRSVGVAPGGVTNPREGRFCIKPSEDSGVKVFNTVPIVSTEYIGTSGFDGLAQWNSSRQGCPPGTFAINTFDASEADPLNDVSFTVVVP
jgi:hypothetical protein